MDGTKEGANRDLSDSELTSRKTKSPPKQSLDEAPSKVEISRASLRHPPARDAVFSVVVEVESQKKPACVADWIVRYYRST